VVEDQAAGQGAVVVAHLEAGRLAVPACGNQVAQGAAELAGERVRAADPEQAVAEAVLVGLVAAPEGPEPAAERREERARVADPERAVVAAEVVVAGSAVAAEGPELVAERRGELKAPGLENG
jgi:hypothetical protein